VIAGTNRQCTACRRLRWFERARLLIVERRWPPTESRCTWQLTPSGWHPPPHIDGHGIEWGGDDALPRRQP